MQDGSVLAILVATDGEAWLPEVIRGLLEQSHVDLDVIAVDNASSDRSAKMLEKAFGANAMSLERRVGYGRAVAAALKVANERDSDASYLLMLHDDAALDPGAVEAMVAAMEGDATVGVVGGKLLDWENPAILQEVGMATDRYGRLFSGLERDEIDQGQHDGTRDVMFCTSASMLVRRSLVEQIGLFDQRFVAMRDDLDLCWRARLAGWRVVVTSDARARHVAAAVRGLRSGPVSGATRYFGERNLIATLAKNYSASRLALVLPVIVAQSLVSAIVQAVRGRRGQARQILGALEWNVVHAPSTLRARARARRHRVAQDADIARFMIHGAPRMRGYVERVLESIVGEPVEGIEDSEIGAPPGGPDVPRSPLAFVRDHPVASSAIAIVLLYVIGARALFGGGGLAGAGLLPFPSSGDFFREFASGWRSTGVAGAHPPGLALLLLGILSTLSFGSAWFAARVLIIGLVPLAGLAAGRAAGRLGLGRGARLATGIVYALGPLALGAFGQGRLPELVLLAAAPGIVSTLLRAGGVRAEDEIGDGEAAYPYSWRNVATTGVLVAIAGALSPWTLSFTLGAAVVCALAVFVAGAPKPLAALRDGLIIAGVAWALLFPWSVELVRPGTPLGVGGRAPSATLADLARLSPVGAPLGVLGWAFLVGALLGFAVSRARGKAPGTALATVATLSLLAAWGAGRTAAIAPRPALPLTGAALAFAILAGLGVSSIGPLLRERSFGLRHIGVALATAFLVAGVALGAGVAVRGPRDGLRPTGGLAPAFLEADAAELGDFRVLWLGGDAPGNGVADATAYQITGPAGATMLAYGVRERSDAQTYLSRVVAAILSGRTDLGGRLLAPLGVREIIVRPGSPPSLEQALQRQSDVRFRETFGGARVFDNTTWLPVAAPLASGGWNDALTGDPFTTLSSAAVAAPLRGLARAGASTFAGAIDPHATTLALAEPFDPHWVLREGKRSVRPSRAFGFATAFTLPSGGERVTVRWSGQRFARAGLFVQLGLWVIFGVWWSRRAAIERGER